MVQKISFGIGSPFKLVNFIRNIGECFQNYSGTLKHSRDITIFDGSSSGAGIHPLAKSFDGPLAKEIRKINGKNCRNSL